GGAQELVEYCVLPVGATACSHAGQLKLESGPGIIFGHVKVLLDGSTVLLFAGELAVKGNEFEPTQEWQSTDGGATWAQVLAGKSVAKPADDEQAVVVPGTNELGFGGQNLGGGAPLVGQAAFELFPLNPAQECSNTSCPTGEQSIPLQTQLARELEKEGQAGDSYASIASGPKAGILGIYIVSSSQTECKGEGFENQLAFVFGEGLQSAENSYAISPKKEKSAWQTELTHADCEVSNPAVAGGPSGFGVVENDTTRGYTVYHSFDQAHRDFDTPLTTISTEQESNPSLSQDGSGGLYLTYASFEGVKLAFSSDGGAAWTGPSYLTTGIGLFANPISSVGANGRGWLVWDNEESVYAQPFVAADAIPPPAPPPPPVKTTPPPPPTPDSSYTIESIVSNSNGTVTITFVPTQSGEATLVLTVPTASIASTSAVAAKSKKCKHGQVKIKGKCRPSTTVAGQTSAKATAGVPLKLTVHLSNKVKALLKKGKTVHLVAKLTFQSALGGTPTTHTYNLTVKGHKGKHKK
ncbi:MAG TPA: hypothetical protein VNY52_12085, partial [Solirubrobacteraceae bacterium]|nr:hypothetical protein [Solirubrobacteraceae bacterium]